MKWHSENNHFKELNRIDGMQTEFEKNIFPGFTSSKRLKIFMEDFRCELEQFNDRIIRMSMYNDIVWEKKETQKSVV